MTFDQLVEVWFSLTEGRNSHGHAFVVETESDAMVVHGIDVADPFRPDVIGRGKTIGWAYIECPNGDRMVAKIKQTATEEQVIEVLSRLAEIAMV